MLTIFVLLFTYIMLFLKSLIKDLDIKWISSFVWVGSCTLVPGWEFGLKSSLYLGKRGPRPRSSALENPFLDLFWPWPSCWQEDCRGKRGLATQVPHPPSRHISVPGTHFCSRGPELKFITVDSFHPRLPHH